jgi:hypothetical protein
MQRTPAFWTASAAAILALLLGACSSKKNPLPPPFKGNAVDNPVSCPDLQNGQIAGKEIHIDGGIPNCAADGLRCPLPGAPAAGAAGACGSRTVVAVCQQGRWALACEAPSDASATEGGGDAASDAAADAAVD